MIEVTRAKKLGNGATAHKVHRWHSHFGFLNSALDFYAEIAATKRVQYKLTGITVDGVPLTADEIAGYPILGNVRTSEEIQARADYCRALYADVQERTPAALAAKAKRQEEEHQALKVPARFGL